MEIKKIIHQHRRDFTAIYECEHCGYSHEASGYDDKHFHESVIPDMVCGKCGESAFQEEYTPRETKYPEGMQV